ncbi:hypothetical protein AB9P05_03970 [Roseivirga sp. BDSF3-8]|uniref:hypothetical protein n=1 Tax=Roseivirga sp. BDSF3-8 TaxID=3241598 RepID=UPI0035319DED
MKISESLKKMILCYLHSIGGQVSHYKFDRMIVYSFRSDILPSFFLKSFLDSGWLEKIIPNDGQMESYKITVSGKEFIVKELLELERIFDRLLGKLKVIELESVDIKGPFLRFSILNRIYKVSVFLDDQNSTITLSLPNDSSKAVEYVEYSLSEVLNTPEILIDRIKKQIDILRN